MLSQKFKAAVKLSDRRAYEIAHEAGLHPSTLSKLLNGIEKVNFGDPRVLKVGEVVGLTAAECFESRNIVQLAPDFAANTRADLDNK